MKQLILTGFLFCTFALISFSQTSTEVQNEQEAITRLIQTSYIEGLANNGDIARIDEGFHPGFVLLGTKNDSKDLWTWTMNEWKENIEARKANGKLPRTGDLKASAEILSIDVNGTLAVVKLKLNIDKNKQYIDYLTLYKLDGTWKIISKAYYRIPDNEE